MDISPKLAHLVLSRHRHRCRRCLAEQFHISSLHRQRRGFRVISDNLRKKHLHGNVFFSLRHNFSNFFKPDKFRGVEFLGPIWAPMRLLPNIPTFMFILVVPALYGNIYRFRKKHSTTTLGWCWSGYLRTSWYISLGVSESERERRKQSNILTTKINFLAWIIEVIFQLYLNQKLFSSSSSASQLWQQPNWAPSCLFPFE